MEQEGLALHIAKSGRLIIQCKSKKVKGKNVFDQRGNKIAKISEIIGPVKAPYISAIPLNDKAKRVIGKTVYIK
tara:strand:+ start:891 stop:1112 length:222 start_codon:yes stop_codon:yes gene_type:complete